MKIWARGIASQKLSRDSGESIFAARHQGVSQGPLGKKGPVVRGQHVESMRPKKSDHQDDCNLTFSRTNPDNKPYLAIRATIYKSLQALRAQNPVSPLIGRLERNLYPLNRGGETPGEKRHININFLLWLTSKWPWDKRLVVPELTGPKSLCVRLETQEI